MTLIKIESFRADNESIRFLFSPDKCTIFGEIYARRKITEKKEQYDINWFEELFD